MQENAVLEKNHPCDIIKGHGASVSLATAKWKISLCGCGLKAGGVQDN